MRDVCSCTVSQCEQEGGTAASLRAPLPSVCTHLRSQVCTTLSRDREKETKTETDLGEDQTVSLYLPRRPRYLTAALLLVRTGGRETKQKKRQIGNSCCGRIFSFSPSLYVQNSMEGNCRSEVIQISCSQVNPNGNSKIKSVQWGVSLFFTHKRFYPHPGSVGARLLGLDLRYPPARRCRLIGGFG